MIQFTIEGTIYNFYENSNLLECLIDSGIEIPHLCFCKGLAPSGNCGLCIVEIEDSGSLIRSCEYKISEIAELVKNSARDTTNLENEESSQNQNSPIKIKTNSPKINKIRQEILGLITRTHPAECAICDKWGECKLAEYISLYLDEPNEFSHQRTSQFADFGEELRFSEARCIKCGLCISFERIKLQSEKIFWSGWGETLQPKINENETFDSEFCLNLLDVCPTGALERKFGVYPVPVWKFDKQTTYCLTCQKFCKILLLSYNNKPYDFRQCEAGLNNLICDDARTELLKLHIDRITKPIIGNTIINDASDAFIEIAEFCSNETTKSAFIVTNNLFNEELQKIEQISHQLGIPENFCINLVQPIKTNSKTNKQHSSYATERFNFKNKLEPPQLLDFLKINDINMIFVFNPDFILSSEISELIGQFVDNADEDSEQTKKVVLFAAISAIKHKELIQIPVAGRYERSGELTKIEHQQNYENSAVFATIENYEKITIEAILEPYSDVKPLTDILTTFATNLQIHHKKSLDPNGYGE